MKDSYVPTRQRIVTGDDLTLENLKKVNIQNPMPGKRTVEAESLSEYTVQMGSNNDLKIEYGFSSGIPKNLVETSIQPLNGTKNILSVFIEDPSKISSLSYAKMLLNNNVMVKEKKRERRQVNQSNEIIVKLKKIGENVYATEPIDMPAGTFKVQLNGVDSKGIPMERLVSTSIESVEPSRLIMS